MGQVGGERSSDEWLRGTILLVGRDTAVAAAVHDALLDSPWTARLAAVDLDATALPADVRAVIAMPGLAATNDALTLAAGRLPLIAVGDSAAARPAGIGTAVCLSIDECDRLPAVLRRELAGPTATSAQRVAASLVAPLADRSRLDDYCDRLAVMLRASHVLVIAAERGERLATVGRRAPADAGVDSTHRPRLTPRRLEAMMGETTGTETERQFGVATTAHRHWSRLGVAGHTVGTQLVARSDRAFSAAEIETIEQLAGLAALAVERSRAEVQLRRTDAVKTEFVRTVSHELRTPLNTVIGYADLLVEEAFGPLGDEQRRILRRVGDRARGLLEVIAATLDLPGVDGGRVSLETRAVSVADLLAELEADTREWGVRDDLAYTWDVAADLPSIVTDPGKLRVLLKNLIANALKFTDRGGITVRARARDDGVELSVEDTGIGIEGEAVQFVFDAFRQANAAATGKYGGVGLGLYIVRRLVAILGGRLRVESEIDVGSKFHVWLPADPN